MRLLALPRRSLAALAVLPLFLLPAAALAQAGTDLEIRGAWARRATMAPGGHGGPGAGHAGAMAHATGAVYVTISNRGARPDAITGASTDVAERVELHETKDVGGVMAMRPVGRLELPAGTTLEMKPGGYHVMLIGLRRDLAPGDVVTLTLTFEQSAPLTVEAAVR